MRFLRSSFLASTVILASCGGGGGGGGTSGPTPTPTPVPTPTPPPPTPTPTPPPPTMAMLPPFAVPLPEPYPLQTGNPTPPAYTGAPVQDYFEVSSLRTQPVDRFLAGGSGRYERSYTGTRDVVASTEGPTAIYDPSTDSFGLREFGVSGETGFAGTNLVTDAPQYRLFAYRLGDAGSKYAFLIGKVGSGTDRPNNRYVTYAYYGRYDANFRRDSRYHLFLGSATRGNDVPTAGTQSFTQSQFAASVYRNNLRYDVTGSVAAQANFATGIVTVTLQLRPPAGSGVANADATLPCGIIGSFSYFSCFARVGNVDYQMWGRLFGPTASEIGIGFSASDINFTEFAIHGQAIGYR